MLAGAPNVLLLDEPANHLDVLSIRWLEKFLHHFESPAAVISHDHRLLHNVATGILDVDHQTVTLYHNYSDSLVQKVETGSGRRRRSRGGGRRSPTTRSSSTSSRPSSSAATASRRPGSPAVRGELDRAERPTGAQRRAALTALATRLGARARGARDGAKVRVLARSVCDLAAGWSRRSASPTPERTASLAARGAFFFAGRSTTGRNDVLMPDPAKEWFHAESAEKHLC